MIGKYVKKMFNAATYNDEQNKLNFKIYFEQAMNELNYNIDNYNETKKYENASTAIKLYIDNFILYNASKNRINFIHKINDFVDKIIKDLENVEINEKNTFDDLTTLFLLINDYNKFKKKIIL